MTYQEALQLRRFDHLCMCGGFAWSMNGRDKESPHMHWCPQKEQYAEWRAAIRRGPTDGEEPQ